MNAGYVRLSRDDDKKNYVSIENQKLIISQYADDHGVNIARWYEDAGISAIYHSREYGLESSSGWHRCSGRRCMGAGGRICEAICGCGFPYFNGGNRMLSGIPFI